MDGAYQGDDHAGLDDYYNEVMDDDLKYLKTIHQVFRNFFISGIIPLTVDVEDNLYRHGIKVVISATENKVISIQDADVTNLHYSCEDVKHCDIGKHFDRMYADIKPHLNKKILIHCIEGKSRSTTMLVSIILNILAGTMSSKHSYTDIILKLIKKSRHQAQPNSGFIKQLRDYEIKLKKAQTRKL
jgi:predicted protein tyrosine phosphatase